MKRRRLMQFASFGSVGLLAGFSNRGLSATLPIQALSSDHSDVFQHLPAFQFETVQLNFHGEAVHRQVHQAHFMAVDLGSDSPLEMVGVNPGRFVMGAPKAEKFSAEPEWPQHAVKVEPFLMGKYPVTQAQWRAVASLPKVNRDLQAQPAHFKGKELPVESVSWLDAMEFCDRLSQHTGTTYRLPSEAEWEYACRAGTTTPFSYGNTITSEVANYGSHTVYAQEQPSVYHPTTTPVGEFPPNAFGLYDMHGNVWEWCADQWHESYKGAPKTQQPWLEGGKSDWRSLRGGGWSDYPSRSRSAYRSGYPANSLNRMIGFRVCSVLT